MQLIARGMVGLGLVGLLGCDAGDGLDIEPPLPPNADDIPLETGGLGGSTGVGGAGVGPGLGDGSSSTGSSVGTSGEPGAGRGRTLVPLGATWRVSSSATPQWKSLGFDDSSWTEVNAPMGRGYPVVGAWDAQGSLFARVSFEAAFDADEVLELRVQRDDGARAYLDGELVGTWNIQGGAAEDEVTGQDGHTFFVAQPRMPASEVQTHVLAVEVTQRTDQDLVFAARLKRLESGGRDDVLVQMRTRSTGGRYAPDNVGAVWVETPQGVFVQTLGVWAGTRREHLLQWNAASGSNSVDAVTSATSGSHHSRLFAWDHTDAAGTVLPRSRYILRAELTENNSNEGEAAGPNLVLPFSTDEACSVATAAETSFADVTVAVPCG
ncbi:MAG: DUF2271 domain-containing protein [Nannocystaceae bacterium]|nr:DUF2271 domain-containing protein [Nannocystaceae bacterium]